MFIEVDATDQIFQEKLLTKRSLIDIVRDTKFQILHLEY